MSVYKVTYYTCKNVELTAAVATNAVRERTIHRTVHRHKHGSPTHATVMQRNTNMAT